MIYFIAQTNQTNQKEAFKLEDRMQIIECRNNSKVSIGVIPGHYATNHSHVNYYVAMTSIKTSMKMANEAAKELAATFSSTHVDTIICLEGTEILGAFLAQSLSEAGVNSGADINVVTPELNAVNQMIFRDNTQKKIWGKQVLIFISSASTGKSIARAAIKESSGVEVHSLFSEKDLPEYETYPASECPMCKAGQKVDALINSFGYSKL